MKIIELEEVDSTNEYLKRSNFGVDTVVCAKYQTAGKGTKGRSFDSTEGGLYISVMRCYKNFPAKDAFKIMVNACVAVCKTLEYFGITPDIRWANDVLVDGKKICGTLIENTFSGGNIFRSIVGMGINVNNVLPPELRHIAVSMQQIAGKSFSIEQVKNVLIENLTKDYSIEDYKKYINYFNKPVILRMNEKEVAATALDIENDGRLKVLLDGKVQKISSAEVSLRL